MDDPIPPPDDDMEDEVLELETVDILREVETMKVPDMLAASIVELLLFCFVSCGFGSGQKLTVSCGLQSRPIYTFFVFLSEERKTCVKDTHTHKTYV